MTTTRTKTPGASLGQIMRAVFDTMHARNRPHDSYLAEKIFANVALVQGHRAEAVGAFLGVGTIVVHQLDAKLREGARMHQDMAAQVTREALARQVAKSGRAPRRHGAHGEARRAVR